MRYLLATFLCLLLLSGCAPKVTRHGYTAADLKRGADCQIAWQSHSALSADMAHELGRIHVRDTGFSRNCSEPQVRSIVQQDGCGLGADVVDVLKESRPNALSTCYRVQARFLQVHDERGGPLVSRSDPRFEAQAVADRDKADRSAVRAGIIAAVVAGVVAGLTAGLLTSL